jgi:chromosomal replication initiator protein
MSQIISPVDTSADPKLIWKECLNIIKENVPFLTYNTWFLPIKPYELENSNLKISVPNDYFVEWIEEHFNTLLNKTIQQVLGDEGKITYIIIEDDDEPVINITQTIPDKPAVLQSATQETEKFETYLNPKYLFENFIKGEGNQLSRAAAYAVSESPGQTSFNPLFIYGGVGLGKTHLIHAIGNKILEKSPEKKVIYLSTDVFTVEFVEAIQSNTVNDFSNYYKSMDTLIIDDIQFLIGKEKTQDYFFHIFNTLHQSGRQIILSSDKPPKELKGLNERLISRFQWGLTTDIQPPDFETRIAILKNKCETFGIRLTPDIFEYVANNIISNIRELEGCLIKLLANASLTGRKIDLELARKTVKEISSSKKINISIDYITKIVCEHFEVDENKIREKTRKKEVVEARQMAMYLSKELTKSSLKTIGLHFGGRDHSTVLHAHKAVETDLAANPRVKEIVDSIKNKIEMGAS